MVEIELFPALDRLGNEIPRHSDVWLNGELFIKATDAPLWATKEKLMQQGVYVTGVYIKSKTQG